MGYPDGSMVATLSIQFTFPSGPDAIQAARTLDTKARQLARFPLASKREGLDGVSDVLAAPPVVFITRKIGIVPPVNSSAVAQATGFAVGCIIGWLGRAGLTLPSFTVKVVEMRNA